MQLWVILGPVGATLESLWGYLGYTGVALDRFCVTLGPFWAYDGYMRGLGGAKKGNVENMLVFTLEIYVRPLIMDILFQKLSNYSKTIR